MNQAEFLTKIFAMLARGVADRKSPLHTPAVATVGLDGTPQVRTVVFRKFLQEEKILIFHTDLRSPKIAELEKNPQITWLFYHAGEKMQFRIAGKATIHAAATDELKQKQWAATWAFGRRCYMGAPPSRIAPEATSGLPPEITKNTPSLEETEIGYPNFTVVATEIISIDCLELHAVGHRRILFKRAEEGGFTSNWLTP